MYSIKNLILTICWPQFLLDTPDGSSFLRRKVFPSEQILISFANYFDSTWLNSDNTSSAEMYRYIGYSSPLVI